MGLDSEYASMLPESFDLASTPSWAAARPAMCQVAHAVRRLEADVATLAGMLAQAEPASGEAPQTADGGAPLVQRALVMQRALTNRVAELSYQLGLERSELKRTRADLAAMRAERDRLQETCDDAFSENTGLLAEIAVLRTSPRKGE